MTSICQHRRNTSISSGGERPHFDSQASDFGRNSGSSASRAAVQVVEFLIRELPDADFDQPVMCEASRRAESEGKSLSIDGSPPSPTCLHDCG